MSEKKITDLDALAGSWQEDAEFDRAVVDFERVDEDLWMVPPLSPRISQQ